MIVEQQMQAANLTAKVYRKIRKEILRGTYKPGQSLTELALTKSLEVSRTPVREALRQLEMEGLVELRPNRGALVIGINGQDIEDIFSLYWKILKYMMVLTLWGILIMWCVMAPTRINFTPMKSIRTY